jgi:antitoxin component of MazEF toxin-antitoxin module
MTAMKVIAFVRLRKINESLYALVPQEVAKQLNFKEGDRAEVLVDGGDLVAYRKQEASKQ